MNTHYTYFLILLLSLAGPLLLSFDRKVAFHKDWRYVFAAMILPAVFYIAWDVWFTGMGVWSFNEAYVTGIQIFNLPVEEVLFFFVVPYCCTFIYACIKKYFPNLHCTRSSDGLLLLIGLVILVLAVIWRSKLYPFYTGLFGGSFIILLMLCRKYFKTFNSATFLVSFGIILIPFLVMNGLLTALPVVMYNDAENIPLRIYTIPVEDMFYGMLLILMNIVIYEKLKERSSKSII